jgi:hypothetical protein
MKQSKIRTPSPAMIVALVALVAALGGGAYAASVAKNSVGAKQLKKNAVVTKKIKNEAVTEDKLATAVRGQAVAWAEVAANGSITAGRGITSANLVSASSGAYCFNNLPDHGTETVTPAWTNDEFGSFAIATVSKPSSADLGGACVGTELAVLTQFFNIAADTAPYTPRAFSIVLTK